MEDQLSRRPLKTRDTKWAAATARWLASVGFRPNQISVLSVACAGFAGALFLRSSLYISPKAKIACLIGAAVFIQLRLLCNLFDGMVAVEGGFRTKSGEIYNDLPDRLSDVLILLPAGFAIPGVTYGSDLGWMASFLAVMTAYVRVLGGSCGLPQNFSGPMAKPHRMSVMTVASLVAALEIFMKWPARSLLLGLDIIIVGAVITLIRRVSRILKELESK
jgi:phosphatidylglycerophosphate synthase